MTRRRHYIDLRPERSVAVWLDIAAGLLIGLGVGTGAIMLSKGAVAVAVCCGVFVLSVWGLVMSLR